MSNKTIVHSEMLDNETRLDVWQHDTTQIEKFTFRLVYLNERGEGYASSADGEWYETMAASIAAGIIDYLMDHVS